MIQSGENTALPSWLNSVSVSSSGFSSLVQSSVPLSSSVGASSSVSADICDGILDWQAKSYNWSALKEYTVYQSKLYSHKNWVSSVAPNQNTGWTLEGDCAIEVSSSLGLSSSQDVESY